MLSPQHKALREAAADIANRYSEAALLDIFRKPLVVLGAPRSGSTLLFETLRCSDSLWSIGTESHFIFNAFPQLHPSQRGYESGALGEADATPELCHLMRACFLVMARNRMGKRYLDLPLGERPAHIRLLEKTPRNALNVPFLLKLFPDMQLLFLHRDPRENIASIMEAWHVGLTKGIGFVTFPNLPGWDHQRWCFLLPPGWQSLKGKTVAEIATFQWHAANETILRELLKLERTRWLAVPYRDFLDVCPETVRRIAEFADFPFDAPLREHVLAPLPLSHTTVTPPDRSKWRRYAEVIEALQKNYASLEQELASLN